jgi:hypothetical protein
MRKSILALLALLVAVPAFALPKKNTPGSSLCWCICDSAKADSIIMWEKDKPLCSMSNEGKCNAQQPNGTLEPGIAKSCDGCVIGSDGNCIPGSSAIKPPQNATMLPSSPTVSTLPQVSPVTTTTTPTRTP